MRGWKVDLGGIEWISRYRAKRRQMLVRLHTIVEES
jgi:hypothetical protein